MQPPTIKRKKERGVALVTVLALVVVMSMLAVTFFIAVTTENQASQSQASALLAQQFASSASQIVMAQVQAASTRTPTNGGNAVAWTSQPGLLRTFTVASPASSASTVYKLYSATNMVSDSYSEGEDAPPATWKSSPGVYCDINAPIARSDGSLSYPVADPAVAGVVPGFTLSAAPGYSGSNPSPTNNPLPMPVRWLYILKDGQLATPDSVSANGTVTFTASGPQPSASNPVVGRVAFWADDETSKVNINTAGYAKNDANYWTYWDTPQQPTKDEMWRLSIAQPWNQEFLRYPGHPATTGLNTVFEGLTNLTVNQTTALTPRYSSGGSLGGFSTTMSANVTTLPLKTERLYATVDELFYATNRTANTASGLTNDTVVDQRRFFITANSRAPETTLLDTPRVTTWPIWDSTNKRTPLENLIAFCSTIGNQPFYFVRSNATLTNELSLAPNAALYSYLQTITGRNLPGVGGNFQTKYASQPSSRDQILTSFFDAIRLANLYDASSSFKYTASCPGWVNTTYGPNGTIGAGRNPTIDEVNVVFKRDLPDDTNVKAFVFYMLNVPTAGPVSPGANVRMEVDGLTNFAVRSLDPEGTNTGMTNWQPLFSTNSWSNSIRSSTSLSSSETNNAGLQAFGGRLCGISTVNRPGPNYMPAFSQPLTNISTNFNTNFIFRGGDLIVRLYSPTNSTTPYQTATINFPDATNVPVPIPTVSYGRFSKYWGWLAHEGPAIKVDRFTSNGTDTVLGVTTSYGDFRSQVLKAVMTTNDFAPHFDYGVKREATTFTTDRDQSNNTRWGSLVTNAPTTYYDYPYVPKGVVVESKFVGSPFFGGDWDSGIGFLRDGSYAPKADEGVLTQNTSSSTDQYYGKRSIGNSVFGFFSPNRQIPSPAIFGSIPTGPWRTLLFRPARSYQMGGTSHFGATSPHDMYFLDFFHMPVVEPYAISEPLSTAGKINMNAQIVPFSSYVSRNTALRALLASVRLTANPVSVITPTQYGPTDTSFDSTTNQTRFPLNISETLLGFQDRYTSSTAPRVFLSEAEICDLDLIPNALTNRSGLTDFWTTNRYTGDNARERPYALLLPRLTARSNSYTVHVTAQALAPGPGVVGWQEGRGKVLSEWRGAITTERYVDPNDARFAASGGPNFLSGTQPVGPYYRFRVLGTRRFNP